MEWLRRCAGWLGTLEAGGHPPVVDLRPAADWPDTAILRLLWATGLRRSEVTELDLSHLELARPRFYPKRLSVC